MRRAVAAVMGTIWGLAVLLQYKSAPLPTRSVATPPGARPGATSTTRLSLGAPVANAAGAPTTLTAPKTTTTPKASASRTNTSTPPLALATSTTAAPTSTTRTTGTTRTTAAPTTSTTTTTTTVAGQDRQVTGDDVSTRYGDLQLRITLSGDRISDVTALKLPSDTSRSKQISSNAEPQLRREALDAQSSQIDTVSGATYTSDGYRQSLQSAIDRSRA